MDCVTFTVECWRGKSCYLQCIALCCIVCGYLLLNQMFCLQVWSPKHVQVITKRIFAMIKQLQLNGQTNITGNYSMTAKMHNDSATKWCKELVVSATSTLILVCLNLQHHQQKWGQFQCQTVSNLNALQWLTSQKFWRRPLKKTRQFWCWTQKFKPLSWLWLQSKQRVWWKWLQQCLHGLSFNTLEVQLVPKKELQFPNFQKRTLNLQSTPTTHSDCKHNLKFHEC